MANKVNYQKELDKIITAHEKAEEVPSVFLHSCCAPCSSYCLEYLSRYFNVTDFYYNPNITDEAEYRKREEELAKLIREQPHLHEVQFVRGKYEPECFRCYELRLCETARKAAQGGYDYFTTTLTISPLKNAQKLNEIGMRLAETYGVKWLPSDFKKKSGYLRSIELSKEYGLYRQDYCGCVYSMR